MGNPYASAAAAVDPGFSIGYGNNYTLERNTRTSIWCLFDITTINYSLNASYSHSSARAPTKFLKYILDYMYVRKSGGAREGRYFRR